MLDIVYARHPLQPGIFDNEFLNECPVERNVNIFVDRSGDQKAGMLLIIGR
jgi:hypothetical protein